jgi:hypothetical protein
MNNAFKWGGIMAVCLIIIQLSLYLTGMSDPGNTTGAILSSLSSYVISIGAIIMGIKAYKQSNNGYLSLGNAIVQGLLICLVAGVAMAIWTYVYMGYIAPDLIAEAKEQAMAGVASQGGEGEEVATQIMDTVMSPAVMGISTLVMKLFLGLFVGLIAGLIMKNERPLGSETL